MSKYKSNVNPDHYKTAGREPLGRDVVQGIERRAYAQSLAREKRENPRDPALGAPQRGVSPKAAQQGGGSSKNAAAQGEDRPGHEAGSQKAAPTNKKNLKNNMASKSGKDGGNASQNKQTAGRDAAANRSSKPSAMHSGKPSTTRSGKPSATRSGKPGAAGSGPSSATGSGRSVSARSGQTGAAGAATPAKARVSKSRGA